MDEDIIIEQERTDEAIPEDDTDSMPGGPDSASGEARRMEPNDDVLTEVDLKRSLKDAQEFMGPGQLATNITSAIEDDTYLADMIHQMQANLDGRKSKEESLPF